MNDLSTFDQFFPDAVAGGHTAQGHLLQLYRNYLTVLATSQLGAELRRRLTPSDLVQETMMAAYRGFSGFRGGSEREFLAWLRQILVHCLQRQVEVHFKTEKRDLRREIDIERLNSSLEASTWTTKVDFASDLSTPSAQAIKRERAVIIANELACLPPEYRDVIVFRNLQSLSFSEVAERMGKSEGAVRMSWLRAIEKIRERLEKRGDEL